MVLRIICRRPVQVFTHLRELSQLPKIKGVFLGKAAMKELAFHDWGQGLEPAATKCEPSVI